MEKFYANTNTMSENMNTLKTYKNYYEGKQSTFIPGAFASSGTPVSNYLGKINKNYVAIAKNIDSFTEYLHQYINDIQIIEKDLSNNSFGVIFSMNARGLVSKYRNSLEHIDIANENIFPILATELFNPSLKEIVTPNFKVNPLNGAAIDFDIKDFSSTVELAGLTNINDKNFKSLIEAQKGLKEQEINEYEQMLKDVEKQIENAKKNKGKMFNTYQEFQEYMNELLNDKALLKATISKSKEMKDVTLYNYIPLLEDYQNYNYEKIDTKKTSIFKIGKMDVSPLEKYRALNQYVNRQQIRIDHKAELENLLKASGKNPELAKMYNYLYDLYGEEEATKYLLATTDVVNQINGQEKAQKFIDTLNKEQDAKEMLLNQINKNDDSLKGKLCTLLLGANYIDKMKDNHLNTALKAVGDGIESFFQNTAFAINGVAASSASLFGIEDTEWERKSRKYTEDEYETMYILQELQSGKYNAVIDNNYEIFQSIGNMIPSMAVGALLTPAVGTTLMGVSAGGGSYHEAMVDGKSLNRSMTYGVLSGLSEATLERAIGAIPGLSDVNVKNLKDFVIAMGKEGLEEGTQEYVDALFKYNIFNEDIDLKQVTENAKKSAIYGAITGGIFNMPSLTVNTVNNVTSKIESKQNINSKEIESSTSKDLKEELQYNKRSLPESLRLTLESNLKKYVYQNTNNYVGLNESIAENGLYHFTGAADKIIESGYIKPSGINASYGNPKTFFFAGVPDVGAFATNLDALPLTATALKIMPTSDVIESSKLKIRNLDDHAISYDGKFDLKNQEVSKEYFVLKQQGEKLVYENVTKEIYDNYANTNEGKKILEYTQNKKNVQAVKDSFLYDIFHTDNRLEAKSQNNVSFTVKNVKNFVTRNTKFLGGVTGVLAVTNLVTTGPLGAAVSIPLFLKSASLLNDSIYNNTIKNSILMTADTVMKTENGSEKITKLNQNVLSYNDFIKSRFSENPQEYFLIRSLNAFQQLEQNHKYGTTSQANTYMLLRQMQKLGFIKNLTKTPSTKETNLAVARFALGIEQRQRNVKMYEMTFETTDKKIDRAAIDNILKQAKVDTTKYHIKTDSKGNTIFDLKIDNQIREKIKSIFNTQNNIEEIKVKSLDKTTSGREFNENITYNGYDYLYRADAENVSSILEFILNKQDKQGKYLIEMDSLNELNSDIISKIPDNVEVRIIGAYTEDYMNGLKSPNGTASRQQSTYTAQELQQILTEIDKFDANINPEWNDYEKAYYAYEYLKNRIIYNPDPGSINNRGKEYDSLMGLVEHESTCIGYSFIYKELLNRMGIDCTVISGDLYGEEHNYTVVKIGKDAFIVDPVKEFLSNSRGITGFGAMDLDDYIFRNDYKLERKINCDNKYIKYEIDEKSIKSALDSLLDTEDDIELLDFDNIDDIVLDSNFNKLPKSAQDYIKNNINTMDYGSAKVFTDVLLHALNTGDESTKKIVNNINKLDNVLKANLYDIQSIGKTAFMDTNSKMKSNFYNIQREIEISNGTFSHELGHALFDLVDGRHVPEEYQGIAENIKNLWANNPEKLESFLQEAQDYKKRLWQESVVEANNFMDHNMETFDLEIAPTLEDKEATKRALEYARKIKLDSEENINKLLEENDKTKIKEYILNGYKNEWHRNNFFYKCDNDETMQIYSVVCGIVDSIYNGNNPYKNFYAQGLLSLRSHSKEYFQKNNFISFDEQFADFTRMKFYDMQTALEISKELFGKEWLQMMERKYASIADNMEQGVSNYNINQNTDEELKNVDIEPIELLDFDDIEILDNIENSDFVNGGVEILETETTTQNKVKDSITEKVSEESLLLSEFVEKFKRKSSNDNSLIIDHLYDYFIKTIKNNPVSKEILKIIIDLKAKNKLKFETTNKISHCSNIKIRINSQDINNMGVIFHELGHILFSKILKDKLPQNFNAIVKDAKAKANNQVIKQLDTKYKREHDHYVFQERRNLEAKYHKTYDEIIELRAKQVSQKDINAYKKECYLNSPESKKYLNQMSRIEIARQIADFKTHEEISSVAQIKMEENYSYLISLEDIVSNVYERRVLSCGHSKKYYKSDPILPFDEMFANFTSLVLNDGDIKYLGLIKKMFGENFFNMLKDRFEELNLNIKLDEKSWDYDFDDKLRILENH